MNGSMDLSADQAVHKNAAFRISVLYRNINIEGCFLDDMISQQKNLRQNKHDKNQRDQSSSSQADADAGNGRFGSHNTNQGTGQCQNRTRCDDGRKRLVQRLHHGILCVHFLLQRCKPAGNHDRIVDIRAHLNGADYQITHEEQLRSGNVGEGKIRPDTSFDDHDQQNRKTGRPEGQQQNHHDDQR